MANQEEIRNRRLEQAIRADKQEPMPVKGKTNILNAVMKDLIDRSEVGKKKYGTALESNNGRDALMDAYQEALDLCMYLRQVIEERKKDQAHYVPDPLPWVNQKGFKPGCY